MGSAGGSRIEAQAGVIDFHTRGKGNKLAPFKTQQGKLAQSMHRLKRSQHVYCGGYGGRTRGRDAPGVPSIYSMNTYKKLDFGHENQQTIKQQKLTLKIAEIMKLSERL